MKKLWHWDDLEETSSDPLIFMHHRSLAENDEAVTSDFHSGLPVLLNVLDSITKYT
jgi:hypothetical protein